MTATKKLRSCEPLDDIECNGCTYLKSRIRALEDNNKFLMKKLNDQAGVVERTVHTTLIKLREMKNAG